MDARPSASDPQASLFSVPDPTDWDDTKFPFLNPLDSALRCDICKDFYSSPVITNCSHTFCSVCVRRALHAEQICPICRTPEQEYRLRKNPAVQELVDAFLNARTKLLEAAREVSRAASSPSAQKEGEDEGGGGREEEQSDGSPPVKRPRSATRTIRSTRSTPRYKDEFSGDVAGFLAPSESNLLKVGFLQYLTFPPQVMVLFPVHHARSGSKWTR